MATKFALTKRKKHGNTLLLVHGQTMSLTFAITLLDNVGGASADDLVVKPLKKTFFLYKKCPGRSKSGGRSENTTA